MIKDIQAIVGTIQRINSNPNVTSAYRVNRISALLCTLNYKLELLYAPDKIEEKEASSIRD